MDKVTEILKDRTSKYGDYRDNANITQDCMSILMAGRSASRLNQMHKEGIHMIVHKLSRIVNGDPDLNDSWDDIAGYARLVSERILQK